MEDLGSTQRILEEVRSLSVELVNSSLRYDLLMQKALRGIILDVLSEVKRTGLPGNHHFYISFDTTFPGLQMSSRLRKLYPHEMTIVLQHHFWDLEVEDDIFKVSLSFDKIPERIAIPLGAVRTFLDPSVDFLLRFGDLPDETETQSAAPDNQSREIPPFDDEDTLSKEEDGMEQKVVSIDRFRNKT